MENRARIATNNLLKNITERNQEQAIRKFLENINQRNRRIVDIDLEKLFDEVNHDKLIFVVNEFKIYIELRR